jgi:hypothetical protein
MPEQERSGLDILMELGMRAGQATQSTRVS